MNNEQELCQSIMEKIDAIKAEIADAEKWCDKNVYAELKSFCGGLDDDVHDYIVHGAAAEAEQLAHFWDDEAGPDENAEHSTLNRVGTGCKGKIGDAA